MMIFLFSLMIYILSGTSEQKVSSNYGSVSIRRENIACTCIWRIYACAVHLVHGSCSPKTGEKEIEKALVKEAEKKGGLALKLTSPSSSGLPDRLVLLPGGRMMFVELKAKGKKPRKLQKAVFAALRNRGFRVEVVDTKEKAREVINDL